MRTRDLPRERVDAFWSRVDASGDCWEWTGALAGAGYGYFQTQTAGKRTTHYTHRVAWELLVGDITSGFEVDHLCRNIRCCNPDHLRVVTHRENMHQSYGHFATGHRRRYHAHEKKRR